MRDDRDKAAEVDYLLNKLHNVRTAFVSLGLLYS